MLLTRKLSNILTPRSVNSSVRLFQVCVMGGASEIGQALCLMLRTEPGVSRLVVHDTWQAAPGVVIELSHIPAASALKGYVGEGTIGRALRGSDLVLLVGGPPQTPGASDRACLEANTEFVKTVAAQIGRMPKMPFVCVVAEPLNSLVPMAAELMRNVGTFDGRRLFGATTIDWIRAQTLLGARRGVAPRECCVPVVGGHSGATSVPLVSRARPAAAVSDAEVQQFVSSLRRYDEVVRRAKRGRAATLSVAWAARVCARALLRALGGEDAHVHAYVENNDFGTSFFAGLVHVDANGVREMTRYTDDISQYECQILEEALDQLRKDVAMGKKILEVE